MVKRTALSRGSVFSGVTLLSLDGLARRTGWTGRTSWTNGARRSRRTRTSVISTATRGTGRPSRASRTGMPRWTGRASAGRVRMAAISGGSKVVATSPRRPGIHCGWSPWIFVGSTHRCGELFCWACRYCRGECHEVPQHPYSRNRTDVVLHAVLPLVPIDLMVLYGFDLIEVKCENTEVETTTWDE
jgi:hypothetical protein